MMVRLLHSTNNKEKQLQVGVSTKNEYWVDIIGQLKIENNAEDLKLINAINK